MNQPEHPDVETASELYAKRFSGATGKWFLEVQAAELRALLADMPPGGRVLDVGGGHAQLIPVLLSEGYETVVLGSARDAVGRERGVPALEVGEKAGDDRERDHRDRADPEVRTQVVRAAEQPQHETGLVWGGLAAEREVDRHIADERHEIAEERGEDEREDGPAESEAVAAHQVPGM